MKKSLLLVFLFVFSFVQSQNQHWIIGGQLANEGQFPWIANLFAKNSSNQDIHLCGGSLIADRWLLTAAHCIIASSPITKVRLNSTKSNGVLNPNGGLELTVDATYVHPDWDPTANNGWGGGTDLALIKLSAPVTTITSAVIPDSSEESTLYQTESSIFTAGWGKYQQTNSGGLSNDLRWVESKIKACPSNLASFYFCIGYTNGETPTGGAAGDSGGPAWIKTANGEIKLLGVVSGGESSYTDLNKPGWYIRVAKYQAWIDQTIQSFSVDQNPLEASLQARVDQNHLIVSINKTLDSTLEFKLFDLKGVKVEHQSITPALRVFRYDLSRLSSGVYFVKITDKDNQSFLKKLIK